MKSLIRKHLEKKYPGPWVYNRSGRSWSADGIGHVRQVLTGQDFTGEYTGEWRACLYFDDNRTPEWLPFSGKIELE